MPNGGPDNCGTCGFNRRNRGIWQNPAPDETLLEIGFGTSALLLMLAARLSVGRLAGIDPSALMVQLARERMTRHCPPVRLDLRQGNDREIDWPDGYFSHVAALREAACRNLPACLLAFPFHSTSRIA